LFVVGCAAGRWKYVRLCALLEDDCRRRQELLMGLGGVKRKGHPKNKRASFVMHVHSMANAQVKANYEATKAGLGPDGHTFEQTERNDDGEHSARFQFGKPMRRKSYRTLFFDTEVSKNVNSLSLFTNGHDALVGLKMLILRADADGEKLVDDLLAISLNKFAESKFVASFALGYCFFVLEAVEDLQQLIASVKVGRLPLDFEFIIYCIEQSVLRVSKAGSNDAVNALSLTEFTKEREGAVKLHLKALSNLRKFWNIIGSARALSDPEVVLSSVFID
jgi:hypothetical protein